MPILGFPSLRFLSNFWDSSLLYFVAVPRNYLLYTWIFDGVVSIWFYFEYFIDGGNSCVGFFVGGMGDFPVLEILNYGGVAERLGLVERAAAPAVAGVVRHVALGQEEVYTREVALGRSQVQGRASVVIW